MCAGGVTESEVSEEGQASLVDPSLLTSALKVSASALRPVPHSSVTLIPGTPHRAPGGVPSNQRPKRAGGVTKREVRKRGQAQAGNREFPPRSQWPDSLKTYVEWCFDTCKSKEEKDTMEVKLHAKLSRAIEDGSLWSKDWSGEWSPDCSSSNM